MSQSQKVHQSTTDTHLNIRKGRSKQWEMQGLHIISDLPLIYLYKFCHHLNHLALNST